MHVINARAGSTGEYDGAVKGTCSNAHYLRLLIPFIGFEKLFLRDSLHTVGRHLILPWCWHGAGLKGADKRGIQWKSLGDPHFCSTTPPLFPNERSTPYLIHAISIYQPRLC